MSTIRAAAEAGGAPALTVREAHVLQVIAEFIAQRQYPPTVVQIGAVAGLASKSSVAAVISRLAGKGYLARDPDRLRGLRILRSPAGEAAQPGPASRRTADPDPAVWQSEAALPYRMLIRYLTAVRRSQHLTQQHVADRMQVPRNVVVALERHDYDFIVSLLARYLAALDCPVTGFVLRDPRGGDGGGAEVIVGPGAGPAAEVAADAMTAGSAGLPVPGRPGLVMGLCGDPVDAAEWDHGLLVCEAHESPAGDGEAMPS